MCALPWRIILISGLQCSDITVETLLGHTHRPWQAAWTRDGRSVITVGEVCTLTMYSLPRLTYYGRTVEFFFGSLGLKTRMG